jgi:radical SAM superfamily enzyme YgiQ (UPF0313 family)
MNIPIKYIEPVFRPPSEGKSLILPVTNGCSWNKCTFCEMYTADQKKFFVRKQDEIEAELAAVAKSFTGVRKIFLADGDAMTLSTRRLKEILVAINNYFPDIQRVSSYCLPRNLKNKSVEDLKELYELGLKILYVGCESGDDQVLECINKGETYQSSKDALLKIKAAGIKSSVMILNGMGGVEMSEQHALNSAKLMNECQPDYLSSLVVSYPLGEERVQAGFQEKYQQLNQLQLFKEIELFIGALELESTIFRSDHASNYLVLKGVLGKDKQKLMDQVHQAIHKPDSVFLREEWQRGL